MHPQAPKLVPPRSGCFSKLSSRMTVMHLLRRFCLVNSCNHFVQSRLCKEDAITPSEIWESRGFELRQSRDVMCTLPFHRVHAEEDTEDMKEPMDRTRWWELTFSIRGFENVTVETLKLFWTVSLGSENPKKHRNRDACSRI